MLEVISNGVTRMGAGYVFPEGMTYDEWAACADFIREAPERLMWFVGDWLAFGAQRPWGKKYDDAAIQTGLKYGTLADARWVSERVHFSRRREKLSWSHHREVAGPPPAEQDQWLEVALTRGIDGEPMTREHLRDCLAAGKWVESRKAENKRQFIELAGPQGVRQGFDRAFRQVTGRIAFEDWPVETLEAWYEELAPISQRLSEIEARLVALGSPIVKNPNNGTTPR
jgi:hypothetical protein